MCIDLSLILNVQAESRLYAEGIYPVSRSKKLGNPFLSGFEVLTLFSIESNRKTIEIKGK